MSRGCALPAGHWEQTFHLLMTRSGGRCEGLTPHCLAASGDLSTLRREQVSIQHRRARGAGGTRLAEAHTNLANLLLLCGTGTTGCHGWVETQQRQLALQRGLWIGHDYRDGDLVPPQEYPLTLASGRRVLLDPVSPIYLPHPDEWGVCELAAQRAARGGS